MKALSPNHWISQTLAVLLLTAFWHSAWGSDTQEIGRVDDGLKEQNGTTSDCCQFPEFGDTGVQESHSKPLVMNSPASTRGDDWVGTSDVPEWS